MDMKFANNLYTFLEIGINNNFKSEDLRRLSFLMDKKDVDRIIKEYPIFEQFIPYSNWYDIANRNVLAMPAYIYDLYKDTGLLPDIENYDINPDVTKLEHWQYINPYMFEIDPNQGFEFAKEYFKNCDIWNLFLSGSARMDYYQGEKTSLETRIKYAIVEYMLKRPQFFTIEDFVENEMLVKKYRKKEK